MKEEHRETHKWGVWKIEIFENKGDKTTSDNN